MKNIIHFLTNYFSKKQAIPDIGAFRLNKLGNSINALANAIADGKCTDIYIDKIVKCCEVMVLSRLRDLSHSRAILGEFKFPTKPPKPLAFVTPEPTEIIQSHLFNHMMQLSSVEIDGEDVFIECQAMQHYLRAYGLKESGYRLFIEDFGYHYGRVWIPCNPTVEQLDKLQEIINNNIPLPQQNDMKEHEMYGFSSEDAYLS